MDERLDRRPSRIGRALRLGVAGVLLAVPLTAGRTDAETTESTQPTYVNLPDWNCDPSRGILPADRGARDFTRPQTSVTIEIISVTYPAKRGDEDFYQTVIYDNTGLQSGQLLRYYSEGSQECPLPYEGAPIIPSSAQ